MSDNMPFNSRSFCDFANDWNFDLVWSSPRYPQSNGMVERSVQTVKMLLKKAKSDGKDPYVALLQYRCAPLTGSTFSPAHLQMNRTLRTKLPASLEPVVVDARQQLVARQQQQKEVYDGGAKPLPPLQRGEVVRMHHNGESQRAIIREHTNTPRSYIVETEDGSTLHRNRRHLRSTAEDPPTMHRTRWMSPTHGQRLRSRQQCRSLLLRTRPCPHRVNLDHRRAFVAQHVLQSSSPI